MKRERDLDQTLKHWLDEGADHAPERFIWEALDDVERTAQRGAWRVSLEELLMNLKPAALALGAAAVIILAVAAYQVLAGPNVGGPGPTPAEVTPDDLRSIVLRPDTAPSDWIIETVGFADAEILTYPTRSVSGGELALGEADALVAGRYAEGSAPPDSLFTSWCALFEDAGAAERALAIYLEDFASDSGWGLGPGEDAPLGDGGAVFMGETTALAAGSRGDLVPARIYIWRVDNLLLAAGGFFDYDPEVLRSVAEGMDARAH